MFIAILLTCALLDTHSALEVEVVALDGKTTTGSLAAWSRGELELTAGNQTVSFLQKDLLKLSILGDWHDAAVATTLDDEPAHLEPRLISIAGTELPFHEFTSEGKTAVLELPRSLTANLSAVQSAPLNIVRAVLLQAIQGKALEQWDEILQLELPSDVLVLHKHSGTSLDYIQGVIKDVSETHVMFELEGELIPVKRTKVAGLVYYRTSQADQESSFTLYGDQGTQIVAANIALKESVLETVTAMGLRLRLPVRAIQLVDFSAGKIVYLSDLEPIKREWVPMVELPTSATLALEYGQPQIDRSFFGGPLSLEYPAQEAYRTSRELKSFAKGVAIRSRTTLIYRVPKSFARFSAVAGIDPGARTLGILRLQILGDDDILLDATISGQDYPLNIDLALDGVRLFQIYVDYGPNLDMGDLLNLCDAKFLK